MRSSMLPSVLLASQVEFRMVVFRPFVGEVLLGTIKTSSEHGIIGLLPQRLFHADNAQCRWTSSMMCLSPPN
jgi:hypothetical protein